MRGADGGPWRRLCALPALWTGLLYDGAALDAAWALVRDWTAAERAALRAEVPRAALKTRFRNRTVGDIARDVLEIARDGLKARALVDRNGDDESVFLETLFGIVESGRTLAEEMLALYHGPWQGRIDRVFDEFSY
jgi:glutamate--cysteine ligase